MRLQQRVVPKLHEHDQLDDEGRRHDQRDPAPGHGRRRVSGVVHPSKPRRSERRRAIVDARADTAMCLPSRCSSGPAPGTHKWRDQHGDLPLQSCNSRVLPQGAVSCACVTIATFLMLGALLVGAAPHLVTAQAKRPLSFVDGVEMPTLSDPQISPDGSQIVFVMNKADWKSNRLIGHIYRINADGSSSDATHLRRARRIKSALVAGWEDDCLRRPSRCRREQSDLSARHQRRRSPPPHQSRRGAGDLTWAPDGKSIWFAATDAKSADEREKERVQDDVYTFEETNFKQRHLWVTDLQGKTTKITTGDFSVTAYDLGNDGTRVVTVRAPSPLLEHSRLGEVWISDADGGRASKLTSNDVLETNPTLSPDNATVAFTASANATFDIYYNDKVFLVPAAGGTPRADPAERHVRGAEASRGRRTASRCFCPPTWGCTTSCVRVDVATSAADATHQG